MARSMTGSRTGRPSRVIATFVFAIFFAAGCAMGWFLLAKPLGGVVMSLGWDSAECTVVNSYVKESSSSSSSTYRAVVEYRYRVGNQDYTSERFTFFDNSSSGRSWKEETVAEYPSGRNFTCYVNPSNPSESVIYRGLTWTMLVGLFPLVFIAIGGFGVKRCLSAGRNVSGSAGRGTVNLGGPIRDEFPSPSAGYPQFIEARNNPFLPLVFMLVMAAIWNGIVSIFLWSALSGKEIQIGVLIVMIPFTLIGIFLLTMVGKSFLALFNPKLTLKITPGALPIGGRGQLAWSISGKSETISKLTIMLFGEEQATYRRGTDTTTATEKFYRKELLTLTNSAQIKTGSVPFAIPEDSIHTFTGRNNKIRWYVEVKGEIPSWPDLEHSINVTVTASKAGVL